MVFINFLGQKNKQISYINPLTDIHNFNIAARTFSREDYFQGGLFPERTISREDFFLAEILLVELSILRLRKHILRNILSFRSR